MESSSKSKKKHEQEGEKGEFSSSEQKGSSRKKKRRMRGLTARENREAEVELGLGGVQKIERGLRKDFTAGAELHFEKNIFTESKPHPHPHQLSPGPPHASIVSMRRPPASDLPRVSPGSSRDIPEWSSVEREVGERKKSSVEGHHRECLAI